MVHLKVMNNLFAKQTLWFAFTLQKCKVQEGDFVI